ncbi:aldehyde dehydrogenase family protein [Nocardioides ungokensis]
MTVETSHDPRTGVRLASVEVTHPNTLCEVTGLAAQAAPVVAATPPRERARWLEAVAADLEHPRIAGELVALADAETALGEARLVAELARTAAQLRFYASVAAEGSYLGATLDPASGTTPALGRVHVPLGPVAVFGASNFPLAFGVLGNDTASALAAGCPVVVKAHPAHPQLSRRLVDIAVWALCAAGAPDGTVGMVAGFEAGGALVRSEHVSAVAFTGSQRGGLALWQAANDRPVVIPVFAEMGTVNPVAVTPAAGRDLPTIASGFVDSFTLGTGQYCTKPGLLLAPAGRGASHLVARALADSATGGWALTEGIAAAALAGVDQLVAAGASVVGRVPGPTGGWSMPAVVLEAPLAALRAGSPLLEECFGPVALVAEYDDLAELDQLLTRLPGALAASVMTAGPDDPDTGRLVAGLSRLVGRVAVDQWPTGVAFSWAQQHGGPWPATSAPQTTSVGAAALGRFVRPVTYQQVPDAALPPALRAANPWGLPRRVGGVLS